MRTSAILLICGLALGQAACASNTKGSWSCTADRGVPCASIDTIDHTDVTKSADGAGRSRAKSPLIDGATPARWWTANDAIGGQFDKAPRREPDQYVKVLIGGWVDASGDFHSPSEIYAVMRRGGWWSSPPITPLIQPRTASASRAPVAAQPAVETAAASEPAKIAQPTTGSTAAHAGPAVPVAAAPAVAVPAAAGNS
jgi:hypothetical protein